MKRCLLASAFVQILVLLGSSTTAITGEALPIVATASVPLYPHAAQSARVQGTVRLRVTTDGQRVVHIENLSLEQQNGQEPTHQVRTEVRQAYKALAQSAEQNVGTWTFLPGASTSFVVSYRYRLTDSADPDNAKVIMTFLAEVEVSIGVPVLKIDTPLDTHTGLVDIPRQQFRDAVNGIICNACQHVAQVGFRIEAIQLGGANQTVNRGHAFQCHLLKGLAPFSILGSLTLPCSVSAVCRNERRFWSPLICLSKWHWPHANK